MAWITLWQTSRQRVMPFRWAEHGGDERQDDGGPHAAEQYFCRGDDPAGNRAPHTTSRTAKHVGIP